MMLNWLQLIESQSIFSFTGEEKVARLLIHNGADFTIKDKDGKSASEIATEEGKPKRKMMS